MTIKEKIQYFMMALFIFILGIFFVSIIKSPNMRFLISLLTILGMITIVIKILDRCKNSIKQNIKSESPSYNK